MTQRDLNYNAYFSEGDKEHVPKDEFHSHNAERLDVARVKDLLLSLPEVQSELALWKSERA